MRPCDAASPLPGMLKKYRRREEEDQEGGDNLWPGASYTSFLRRWVFICSVGQGDIEPWGLLPTNPLSYLGSDKHSRVLTGDGGRRAHPSLSPRPRRSVRKYCRANTTDAHISPPPFVLDRGACACVCALPPKIRTTIKRVGITLKGGAGAERGGKGREEMSWESRPEFCPRFIASCFFDSSTAEKFVKEGRGRKKERKEDLLNFRILFPPPSPSRP